MQAMLVLRYIFNKLLHLEFQVVYIIPSVSINLSKNYKGDTYKIIY